MIHIKGASESRVAKVLAELFDNSKGKALIVVPTQKRAGRLAEDLSFFLEENIYVMPADDNIFLRYEAKSKEELWERSRVIKGALSSDKAVIISSAPSFMRRLPEKSYFLEREILLRRGEEKPYSLLIEELSRLGFERVDITENKGQYSVRGFTIDIFSPSYNYPVRLIYEDDMISSLRTFDQLTQRSMEDLDFVKIFPASESSISEEKRREGFQKIVESYERAAAEADIETGEEILKELSYMKDLMEKGTIGPLVEKYGRYFYENTSLFYEYFQKDDLIIIEEPERILEELTVAEEENRKELEFLMSIGRAIPEDEQLIKNPSDFIDAFNAIGARDEKEDNLSYSVASFKTSFEKAGDKVKEIVSKAAPNYNGSIDLFLKDLGRYKDESYKIEIACSSHIRKENLQELLRKEDLLASVTLKDGSLTQGMEFLEDKYLLLSDGDIFKTAREGRRSRKKHLEGKPIRAFTDLAKGDYVVHEYHGVGKFVDMRQLEVSGNIKDYLKIQYQGQDVLYIPAEQMALIQKYVGKEGVAPKINRLSGNEWRNTKAKAKEAALELARELLIQAARRKMEQGHRFSKDTVWQREFEDEFPYEETEDQLRTSLEIKRDMEREMPMDRLLAGDVGFGKTEVAQRAAFKCVQEGKQVAVIVPTTILASQHFTTFKERFKKYPFNIEMLSRFRTQKEQKEIIGELKKGTVDIIIATHRLLSSDIAFKDLGLLIIDEEQRFGVKSKETIKQLKTNVDVLSLSATPIPRTLHMSLSGIRDMSIIEDPPEERYPIKTYVLEEDQLTMKEAIEQEIKRGGQVYIVYNRVRGIKRVEKELQSLVPEGRIITGHGQMGEKELEDVMAKFMEGEYDILLATTIIEAGLDIPNVNTILILEADHYGLSTLYQLRGRVGRSNRIAYCYLFYKRGKILTEASAKRLSAIREFTELGSGFKISMRDLEIRGAGNLLGQEQSGHMMMVGYEHYVRMLDEAVRALRGESVKKERVETSVELKVSAYIPQTYILDESLRLRIYKRIADIESREDMEDMALELEDRFSVIPDVVRELLKISLIRHLCENLGIKRVWEERGKVVLNINKENNIEPVMYAMLYEDFKDIVEIKGGSYPIIRLNISSDNKTEITLSCLEKLNGQ